MIQTTLNLPNRRTLHLKLVKARGKRPNKPLFAHMGEVLRAKKGSKISRFFRYVFERKTAKKLFGLNAAIMIMATSFVPQTISGKEIEQTVITTADVPLSTERNFRYPVDETKISQGFYFLHPAIDLDGLTGDNIYPIKRGVVEAIEYSRFAYGNAIYITHENGLTSLYAHLDTINVEKGQEVFTSDVIGTMGATGRAFGDHLHLEIYDEGRAINPYTVLPK